MASKRTKKKPKDEISSEDSVDSVALGRAHRSSVQGSQEGRHTDTRLHGYAEFHPQEGGGGQE